MFVYPLMKVCRQHIMYDEYISMMIYVIIKWFSIKLNRTGPRILEELQMAYICSTSVNQIYTFFGIVLTNTN